jgi:Carboxypeptidase regulatory-like domain/Tetratricopeptide repeat
MPIRAWSGGPTFMRKCSFMSRLVLAAILFLGIAHAAVAQPGRVGGIVKDENGDPVKGATITAENTNIGSSFTATTDDKGRFTLIGLRAGTWRFIAQAPGFAPQGGDMPVRSGNPNPPIQFTLKRTGPAWSGAMAGIGAKELQNELTAADALFNQQKWDEAIAAYRAIAGKTPALSVINLQIGAAYRNKKDYDNAMAAYTAMLAVDPQNEKATVAISQTDIERGDMQAAEQTLVKAASASGAGREIFYNLGEVKTARHEPDEASKWYEKASQADPSWGKPLYKLGLLAKERGDRQRASTLMTQVIAVDPVSPEAALAKAALDELNR